MEIHISLLRKKLAKLDSCVSIRTIRGAGCTLQNELKTPISIINTNYDLLLANSEETIQSQMKWLDYIRIGTDRMTKLTNNHLMLAKFDDPEKILQKTSFDLSKTIQAVVFSMETTMLEKRN